MKTIIFFFISLNFFVAFCNDFRFLSEEITTEEALALLQSTEAIDASELIQSGQFGAWVRDVSDAFLQQGTTGDPHLNGTLNLNIFEGRKLYNEWKKENQDIPSSFFGYALWHLIQTLKNPEFSVFHLRYLAGQHFYVKNPDILIPSVYGEDLWSRNLSDICLKNTYKMKTLKEFMIYYQDLLENTRQGKVISTLGLPVVMAHFIGKLNRSYESFSIHMFPKYCSGRPIFYFDTLMVENLGLVLPHLHYKLHHAYILPIDGEDLISSFENLINSKTLHTVSPE
jgi:chloramphenicol O-acetyltransferase